MKVGDKVRYYKQTYPFSSEVEIGMVGTIVDISEAVDPTDVGEIPITIKLDFNGMNFAFNENELELVEDITE